jgi:hypothetical protein
LLGAFKDGPNYFPITSEERFKVLARFDGRYMQRLPLPIPNDRFDICALAPLADTNS